MDIAEADGATGATGIDRLHPVFPGQARVWEMIRAFWPFTRGRRRVLVAQITLSLVLFGATALVPLQIGHLLTAALSSASADRVAARYVVDPIELQRATQAVLAPELETPAERRTAGVGIRAAMDQLRVTEAEATLDALFPSNMAYRTDAFTSIEDPSPGWEQEADALVEAPRIRRDDLEEMRERALANPSYATNRAFNWVVSLLLTDTDAKSQRSQWRTENFRTELYRFAALLLSIFVLRAVTLLLAQRATLFGARRLQDAVFERVHSTALVDAGALARPSMVSRCGTYVDRVTNTLLKAQTEGIPSLAALLFSSAVLLYIDVPIGLIMIGVIVAFETVRRLVSTRWSRLAHERLDLNTALSEVVDGSIAGSGGVRAARAEADERRRFAVKADEVMRHTRRLENMAEAFRLTAFGFGQIAVLVVIAVVGFVRKDLNLAEATAVVLYVREVSASLQELPGMVVDMQEAAPYMRRLRRVLAAPLRRTPPAQALPAPVGVHEVRLDNVTFRYPDESPGCTDVSLRANRGRWTMLVGLETSGVHTVAELVAGIEEPDSGSITVGGTDLGALDERSLSGLIAVLPAQPSILEATVAENIGWGNPDADRTSIARAASLTGLGAWLASSPDGLETVIGRSRQHLPMEVRVRIAAARVIASAAPVVVIDDPTTALDREVAEELWAALRAQLDGRVVIGVTTRLDLLGDNDLVLAFHAGQVVEQGNRQDLLHSGGRFGRLWSRFVEGAEGIVELGNVPALAALDPEVLRSLTSRLVTERFEPGETIFVEGEPADRVFLIVDGVVDLFADERRLSSVRAGNYFGDLDLANETARTTSARARTPLVTKSLHRLAVSRGVAGVLHRPEEERVVYTWIARHGAATRAELDVLSSRIDVERALSGLLADGTLTTSMDASGATTYRISRSRRQSTHGAGTSLLSTLFPD